MKDNATPYHGWFDVERGEFTHFNHHRDGGEMVLNPSGESSPRHFICLAEEA